jgi:hypothetical protein
MIAGNPLFNGTIHLTDLAFRRKDQNGAITRFTAADIATVLEYLQLAVPTIVRYASQYGECSAAVSPTVLEGQVDIDFDKYSTGWIENWVNTLAKQYGIPSNDCICILNPPGIVDTDNALPAIGGYHQTTSQCRYMMINVTQTGLTVADLSLSYADVLSHEIAEMIVDPDGSGNPEVCDPCSDAHTTLNFFMRDGSYVGNVTDAALPPVFDYLLEGIAQPAFVHESAPPSFACGYFPEIWRRLGTEKFLELTAASYSDGRTSVFALGGSRDIWRLDQVGAGGPWGAWQSFGGHDLQDVAVHANADGRLEVFARGADGQLYHLWQTGNAGVWGQWANLGGSKLRQIDVAADRNGTLNVVGLNSDGEYIRIRQTGPNGGWDSWTSLGGQRLQAARASLGMDADLLFLMLDANHILYATTTADNPNWQRIQAPLLKSFEVVTGDDGRLHIAGLTNANTAIHIVQTQAGAVFGNWEDLAGTNLSTLVPALNADGRVEFFARGGDGKVYHRWQHVGGGWSEWAGLGATQDITFNQVRPLRTSGGQISAFGLLSNGIAGQISQNAPNGSWVG